MRLPLHMDARLDPKFLDQVIDIDWDAFNVGPEPFFLEMTQQHPELYVVARRGDQVKAYGLILPLRRVAFDAIKEGKLWETEFEMHDIDMINPHGFYIAAIAAHPRANIWEKGMLVGTTMGTVLRIPQEAIAVAVSQAGEDICHTYNLSPKEVDIPTTGVDGFVPRLYSSH